MDPQSPAALPLPPPSGRNFTGAMAAMPQPPAMPPPYGAMPMQAPPPTAPASKGGIVFLIIGLSAVIAVLILVIVWALLLR
jgi:hypothetical protein